MDVQEIARVEREKLQNALADVRDPLSALLKTHLFIEQGLERIIRARLPQPEKLLTRARLTFIQKLLLVDSFEIFDEQLVEGVRKLNSIRNDCAHQLDARLNQEVVEKFGNTQRPWFTKVKNQYPNDPEAWLARLLPRLAGKVGGFVLATEHGAPSQ